MSSCLKCGKTRLRKNRDGFRYCKRCGTMPGQQRFNRTGFVPIEQRPEYWRTKALQERRKAHQMKKVYTRHNWRIYFSLDMQRAIRSWQYFRQLLKNQEGAHHA